MERERRAVEARATVDGADTSSFDASLSKMIADVIENSPPDMTFTADHICRALPSAKIESVRTTLARLAEQGRIDKVGRGEYRARSKSSGAPPLKEGN